MNLFTLANDCLLSTWQKLYGRYAPRMWYGLTLALNLIFQANFTDQVLVAQLTASAAGAYTGRTQLSDGHSTAVSTVAGGLMFSGVLANG